MEIAQSSQAALAELRSGKFSLLIVQGRTVPRAEELLAPIQGDVALKDLPVIFVRDVASQADSPAPDAKDTQMVCLTRPFHPMELVGKVRRLLPSIDPMVQTPPAPPASAEQQAANVRFRILAVDEEPAALRLIRASLENQGYAVETAEGVESALARLRTERFDLLVTNGLTPPPREGELIVRVRHESDLRDLLTLVVADYGSSSDFMGSLDAGADMYLLRPFNPQELTAFVRRLLTTPSRHHSNHSDDEYTT